jgi:hypothetical protein
VRAGWRHIKNTIQAIGLSFIRTRFPANLPNIAALQLFFAGDILSLGTGYIELSAARKWKKSDLKNERVENQ